MTKTILLSLALTASGMLNSPAASASGGSGDAQFSKLAEEYISGYLKWRPLAGTSLGFHQYDGKATDFSHTSLEIELARLKSFDRRLEELDRGSLSAQAFYDYRILHNAIKREIFSFEGMRVYWQNPMTYSSALDVNTYIKRNFAPLEERARSIVAILKQAPRVFAAARANLAEVLPRPQIETSIQEATGARPRRGSRGPRPGLASTPNRDLDPGSHRGGGLSQKGSRRRAQRREKRNFDVGFQHR